MTQTRYGYGGIFSSPVFKWQRNSRNHRRRDHVSKGKSSEKRRVSGADMEIFLTEHMTEHTLDGTICKIYLEPQDEVETTAQDSNSTTCKIHEAPKDEVEVLIAQLSTLADMIKKRDWDLLSIELRAHAELREGKGLLLHLALRFDAPLSIISQLTHGIHNSASHRNAEGRLPLHVAISKISQLSVISHVLMLNPRACTSVDNQGSTPLHICFDENVMHAFKASQFRELVRNSSKALQSHLQLKTEAVYARLSEQFYPMRH